MFQLATSPLRNKKNLETWWNQYHDSYITIENYQDFKNIPEPVYIYFLLSDFYFAINRIDYCNWEDVLADGQNYKVEQLRRVMVNLASWDSEWATLALETLHFLEEARTKAKTLSPSDPHYKIFSLYCHLSFEWGAQFEARKKEDLFEYLILRWPDKSTVFDKNIKLKSLAQRNIIKNNDSRPWFPEVKIIDTDIGHRDLSFLLNAGLVALWRGGCSHSQLIEFYHEAPRGKTHNFIEYIENYLLLELSQETMKRLVHEIDFRKRAKEILPDSLISYITQTEETDLKPLKKMLNTLNYHTVDLRNMKDNTSFREYFIPSLRMAPDLIIFNAEDISSLEELKILSEALVVSIGLIAVSEKDIQHIIEDIKKASPTLVELPFFNYSETIKG